MVGVFLFILWFFVRLVWFCCSFVWVGGVCFVLGFFVVVCSSSFQSCHLSENFQIYHELVKFSLFPTRIHMALEKRVTQLSQSLLFCVSG